MYMFTAVATNHSAMNTQAAAFSRGGPPENQPAARQIARPTNPMARMMAVRMATSQLSGQAKAVEYTEREQQHGDAVDDHLEYEHGLRKIVRRHPATQQDHDHLQRRTHQQQLGERS